MTNLDEILEKVREEVKSIKILIGKPNFDIDSGNYRLKLHFKIIKECVEIMEQIIKDKGIYRFYPKLKEVLDESNEIN